MRGRQLELLSQGLKICLQITFAVGFMVTVFLWWILKEWFGWYFWYDMRFYYASLVLVGGSGVCSLVILWQLIALLKTIGNPFININVQRLKRIAVAAFIISFLFFVLLFFRISMLIIGIAYTFLIAGFACFVLAGLFQRAVAYKDENDLTV